MITSTSLWKLSLAKTSCMTQWVLCISLYQKKYPELQLLHKKIVLLQVVIHQAVERKQEELSKVLVQILSLIITSQRSQALNWCRWDAYQLAEVNSLLWMIQFNILPKFTSMWVVWNAQHRVDKKVTEKISYLPAINQSPKSTAVVKEMMKRAQQLTVECGKRDTALTSI